MTDASRAWRTIAFATLALWVSGVQAANQCDDDDSCLNREESALYDSARSALDAGNIQEAILLLDDLRLARAEHDRAPNSAVRHSLAVALIRAGRSPDARALLDGWIAEGPEDATATRVLMRLRASIDRQGPGAISVAQSGVETGAESRAHGYAATTSPGTMPEQALRDALERWRSAWEAGDATAYLASYAPGTSPRSDMDRATWEAQRRQRVSPARNMRIEISEVVMTASGQDGAVVEFQQRYRSRGYADAERKRLEWRRGNGVWRIVGETSLRR